MFCRVFFSFRKIFFLGGFSFLLFLTLILMLMLLFLPLLPVRAQTQAPSVSESKPSESSEASEALIPLTVDVQGIQGEEYENVMASIQIVLQQKKPGLTVRHIHRLHKAAPEQIAKALAPLGYYSVEVQDDLTKEATGWHAVYKVVPGPPVRVDKVNIEVTGSGKDKETFQNLAETFPLKKGDHFKDSQYEKGKKDILSEALHNGYMKARFTKNKVLVHRKKQQAEIQLILDTGPLFFFGKTLSEQDIIMPDMLQRYFPYSQGDVYSLTALNQLQTDLYATGYFSQVVVEPQYPAADSDAVDIPVQVELRPSKKNRYSFGIGYGTDTGPRGNLGWKNRMLNKRGHTSDVNIQLAENGNRASAEYAIPIFDLRYEAVDFSALFFDETWEDTWIKQLSISGTVNHSAPEQQYGLGLEYLHENYTVGVTSGAANLLIPSGYFTMIVADDRVKTEHGIRLGVSLKGGSTDFLSSTNFLQARANGKIILTPWTGWRVLGRLSIGAIMMESIDELPPSLRFYAGGDHSVRGYAYKALGPQDASGKVVGGQYLTETSIELERQMNDHWSVAAFYDLGNAYDDIDAELQAGAGLGIRMNLPFGQVRLDVASALSDADYPLRIHLTIGADL